MAFIRGANVVTDGLVLALDAANPKSYPSSGTTWSDLSGTSVTGSLVNGPTFNSANGGSIVFDGVDDSVNCGNFITATNIKTMSCWVKFNNTSGNQEIISKSSNCRGVELLLYNNNLSFFVMDCVNFPGRQTEIFTRKTNLNTISWFCIVATHNGPSSPMKLYLNGIEVATGTAPTTIDDSTNLLIGKWNDSGRFLNGNIASVQIYNRALSAAEVLQNYNATKSRFGLS